MPLADHMIGKTLHICINGRINRYDRCSTSSWEFSSETVNYSDGHTFQGVCTKCRALPRGLLTALYILHKAECANSTGTSPQVIIQFGHKKVLKVTFRSTPVSVTTANQPYYDLILDIRAIRHLLHASIHSRFSEEANVPSQHPAQDLVHSTDYVNRPSFENHQLSFILYPQVAIL